MEKQKEVLQEMMLKYFGWERFYKGSNPRGNMLLSDYRREKAAETAKEAELKLDAVMDRIASAKTTIQAQAEQMEAMQESLEKGVEAEQMLHTRITNRKAELEEVTQDLTDKKNEVEAETKKLHDLQEDAGKALKKAALAEEVMDLFRDTSTSEREKEYFERIVDLTYENSNLKAENQELRRENSRLREKLQQAYDFMR